MTTFRVTTVDGRRVKVDAVDQAAALAAAQRWVAANPLPRRTGAGPVQTARALSPDERQTLADLFAGRERWARPAAPDAVERALSQLPWTRESSGRGARNQDPALYSRPGQPALTSGQTEAFIPSDPFKAFDPSTDRLLPRRSELGSGMSSVPGIGVLAPGAYAAAAEKYRRRQAPPRASDGLPTMQLSAAGVDFIKSFEQGPGGGVAKRQYPSVEGGTNTVGWGHKLKSGEDFSAGLTREQADELFVTDARYPHDLIRQNVKVPLTSAQYDALVSLGFTSPKALKDSTLLRLLNAGDYSGAADQFLVWNNVPNAQGKLAPSRGLTTRRAAERDVFLNGVYNNH